MKPGIQTTEFYISILAVALGGILASGIIPTDSPWAQGLGAIAAALGAMGYSVSRGQAKSK